MAADPPSRPALSLVAKDAAADFYSRRAKEAAGAGGPVLILGSATGRIACELGVQGFQVTGVEPSEPMLEAAHALRATEPPEAAARIHFQQADVRAVRLGKRYPLVLAPQNAFGLLGSVEDLEQLLASALAHLQPQGSFVFDVALPALGPFSPRPESPPGKQELFPLPPRAVFVPHLRNRKRARQSKKDRADPGEQGIHRLRLRQFTPPEIDDALGRAGLVAMEKYGTFEGKPFDPGDARVIVVAAAQEPPARPER